MECGGRNGREREKPRKQTHNRYQESVEPSFLAGSLSGVCHSKPFFMFMLYTTFCYLVTNLVIHTYLLHLDRPIPNFHFPKKNYLVDLPCIDFPLFISHSRNRYGDVHLVSSLLNSH